MTTHKQPRGAGWSAIGDSADLVGLGLPGLVSGGAYQHPTGLRVLSTLVIANMPDGVGTGPQWHVSVTAGRATVRRPSSREAQRALIAFDMVGAEEDNHEPGRHKNYWRPVDPARRVDCECKADEVLVIEPDGHRWSNAATYCRGCIRAVFLGEPCPLHGTPGADQAPIKDQGRRS